MHYRHVTTIKQAVHAAIIHTGAPSSVHNQKEAEKSEKRAPMVVKITLSLVMLHLLQSISLVLRQAGFYP